MIRLKCMLVATLFMLMCGTATAYEFEAGGVYYNVISVDDKTVEVTYEKSDYEPSYAGTVVIPATVEYQGTVFTVVNIGEHAFYGCTNLTRVTLPVGLKRICGGAFCDCSGLEDVTIPNTVTTIDDDAFNGCSSFKHVVIPPSVMNISDRAFFCNGVETITIEDSPVGINAGGYWGRSFAFPNVRQAYIGRNCGGWQAPSSLIDHWYGNGALQRVEFGPNVTEIPYCMLYGDAYNLTELVLSPNIKKIDTGALSGCYALKRLELPDGVEEIGDGALGGGWGDKSLALTDLIIGSKIKIIREGAFAGCRNLQNVTVRRPDAITIPENAFDPQTYLTATLYVPEGCKETSEQTISEVMNIRTDGDEVDSLEWAYIWREYWHNLGFSEDYYSDTIYAYKDTFVPGYSEVKHWSNFLKIEEGEGATVTRWPVTIIAMGEGSVSALGREIRNTTYTRSVDEGTAVSVLLLPDEYVEVSELLLNGQDVKSNLIDNSFIIPSVSSKDTLRVVFKEMEASLVIRTSEQGELEQMVKYGTSCTFKVSAAKGFVVHSVVFNDVDVTNDVQADGTYTTPAIQGKASLSVTFETDPSGINAPSVSSLRVLPSSEGVTVQGLTRGELISVYASDGKLVTQRKATSTTEYIALPAGQVYVVTAEGRSVKMRL